MTSGVCMIERVVLIEFNELNESLLDGFMADGSAPNFLRLFEQSEIFTTDASEDEHLEPWIQWPTLHSGTTYGDHGVYRLGEGQKLRGQGIAAELSRAGVPVGPDGVDEHRRQRRPGVPRSPTPGTPRTSPNRPSWPTSSTSSRRECRIRV